MAALDPPPRRIRHRVTHGNVTAHAPLAPPPMPSLRRTFSRRTRPCRTQVTEHQGRAQAAHMVGLIARVLDVVEEGSGWQTDSETVRAFTARVGVIRCKGCCGPPRRGGSPHPTW